MKQRGLEECVDVLPLISEEQWVRLVDYDGWRGDELVPRNVFQWLDWCGHQDKAQIYRRFREMDEETQIASVEGLIKMYTLEEIEKLSESVRDKLHVMPCNQVFYKVETDDPELERMVSQMVDAAIQQNLPWAYQLLAYASYSVPNEARAQAEVFRRARLEEDGFVAWEESQAMFARPDLEALTRRWTDGGVDQALVVRDGSSSPYLLRVWQYLSDEADEGARENLRAGMLHLANALCTAADVDPDDLPGLEIVLGHARSLVGLGLDVLSQGNVERGAEILLKEHPRTLFGAGLAALDRYQRGLLEELARAGVPGSDEARKSWSTARWGRLLNIIDTRMREPLGWERVEFLKGLCNRFPMMLAQKTRGADGVEKMLFAPIDSRGALGVLASSVGALIVELRAATRARREGAIGDLERLLATAFARLMIGGEFHSESLSSEETRRLIAMDGNALQEGYRRCQGFLEGLVEQECQALTALYPVSAVQERAWERVSSILDRVRAAREVALGEGPEAMLAVMNVVSEVNRVGVDA
jgi:hypothetical protein